MKIEEIDDSGNVVKEVGTAERSLDKDYLPFVSKSPFALSWPGSTDYSKLLGNSANFSRGLYSPPTWSTNFASAPKYTDGSTAGNGAEDKTATAGEWVTVNRLPEKSATGEAVDQTQRNPVDERSYRENLQTGKKLATPLAMVYGTFDPAAVQEAAGDINRLPLGGYDPTPMTLTKDAQGKDVPGTTLKPSLSATGLVSQSAGAITDYYGLAAARGYEKNASVIDAVRVRAGAAGSWKQAQPEVEKLATEIRDMGLEATVVAGSAREDANIFVPGYSKDDAGKESALGTVQQSWVRQNAADAVAGSLTATNLTLLFLTLCGAALLTGASTVSYVRLRRSEAGTLRAMGWTQRRIRSWVLEEFAVGAGLLAVAGIVLSLLSWNIATAIVSAVGAGPVPRRGLLRRPATAPPRRSRPGTAARRKAHRRRLAADLRQPATEHPPLQRHFAGCRRRRVRLGSGRPDRAADRHSRVPPAPARSAAWLPPAWPCRASSLGCPA